MAESRGVLIAGASPGTSGSDAVLIAAATRPHPGETLNGDAWTVQRHGQLWRVALIDGLGHGPDAHAAARAAVQVLQARPDLAPAEALAACHCALLETRGAVIAIATIDPHAGQLVFAGVGNVEARLRTVAAVKHPISYRGIVGASMPRFQAFDLPLGQCWVLAMHTDGVRARFSDALLTAADHPESVAQRILDDWGGTSDDATVVVARPG